MKIMDFLSKKAITANLKGTKKDEIIKELVDLLIDTGEIEKKCRNKFIEILLSREELGSTGIGQGVGIPHAKADCVDKMVAAFGLSKNGVNFDSLDGEPVYIFFLLLAPQDSAGPHLKALALISRSLKDKYFRENLKQAQDEKIIIKILNREDEKRI